MHSKWDAIRGNIGFFITMAASLLVIGICGYFLLFDQENATTPVPTETPVTAPAPEIRVPDPIETPVEEETAPVVMPSEEVDVPVQTFVPDNTPVVAEAPNLIVAPLEGEVISAFSVDALVFNPTLADWRIHDGVDIAAEEGSSVLAAGSVCQAIGNPLHSLITSVCRQLVVLLPAAWLLAQTGRLELVWFAFPIAEVMSLILSAVFLRRTFKNANARMAAAASMK